MWICGCSLFLSGGIVLEFSGNNFDSVQSPLMEITDSRFSQAPSVVSFLLYNVASFLCFVVG